jgi:protein MpaA
MKLAALVSLLASLSVVAPASARTVLLGRSWQGRPIRAVEVGNRSGTRVLVVGCIHGNETAGIAIAGALERLAPSDLDLWVVPDLNSDGVAAGTRQNAHGVDLNRNFPWHWRPMSGVYASGPRPLSEFARVSGLPYHPMPQLAGSAISWQNNTLPGTTAFAAELPAGQPDASQVGRYVRAVLAAARTR